MTLRSAHGFHQYAGAFTVIDSAIPWLRPGMIAEFARYSGPTVHIFDIETGEEQVEDAEVLAVDDVEGEQGRWRITRNGSMLLEVGKAPPGYPQRDFSPPRGYRFITRVVRPRVAWPDPPEWVSLRDLVRSD